MDLKTIEQRIEFEVAKKRDHATDRSAFEAELSIHVPRSNFFEKSLKDMFHAVKGKLFQIPLLGSVLRWCVMILRINVRIDQINERLEELFEVSGYTSAKVSQIPHLTHHLNLARDEIAELRLALAKLRERGVSVSTASAGHQVNAHSADVDLGRLYVAFEERFRATSDDLLAGFQRYQPFLTRLATPLKSLPCLDVGCGRGEWLSFVKELGFPVLGVDMNAAMVKAAADRGIEAVEDDGIHFLGEQKAAAFSVVSAFHVVEHLTLDQLLRLIDESFRVLAPGGIAIFETPNPENILVGACNFYTDPTHKNPIPPHTLDFLVLQRGFDRTTVLRKGAPNIPVSSSDPAVSYMLDWFKKEQDYAIIAYKS